VVGGKGLSGKNREREKERVSVCVGASVGLKISGR